MSYLFDVFIVALQPIITYTVMLIVLFLILFMVDKVLRNDHEKRLIVRVRWRILLLPYLLILILSASSGTVTWKNSLDTTETSIREINQYNRERIVPKIVDTTKQPGANSEALKKELKEQTQSWKNNSDPEKID